MFYFSELIKVPAEIRLDVKNNFLLLSKDKESTSISFSNDFKLCVVDSNFLKIGYSIQELKKRRAKFLRSNFFTLKKKIENAIFGLCFYYSAFINLEGIGYKVSRDKFEVLHFKLGFSHDLAVPIPDQVLCYCPKETILLLKSFSKEALGNFVSTLEQFRIPDVYDNKGLIVKGKILNKKKVRKK